MKYPTRFLWGIALLLSLVSLYAVDEPKSAGMAEAGYGYSAAGLFNQANAYAHKGKSGMAILFYERAKLLSPHDDGLAANLHWVRSKAGLPDPSPSVPDRLSSLVAPNTMAWLGCCGLMIAGIGVLLSVAFPRQNQRYRALACLGTLLVAGSLCHAVLTWPKMKAAVVIVHESMARISPSTYAETACRFQEGEMVAICSEHNDFDLVEDGSGHTGWVARKDLERVIPSPDHRG